MGNFGNSRFGGRSRDRQGGGNRGGGGYSGGNRGGGGYSGGNRGGGGYSGGNRGGGFSRNSGPKEMYDVICDKCKVECQVPFKQSTDKPVLCSNCFSKNNGSGRGGSRNNNSVAQGGISQEQFNQLNTKLDKVINILQQLEIDEEFEDEEEADEEEEDEEEEDEEVPSKEGKEIKVSKEKSTKKEKAEKKKKAK